MAGFVLACSQENNGENGNQGRNSTSLCPAGTTLRELNSIKRLSTSKTILSGRTKSYFLNFMSYDTIQYNTIRYKTDEKWLGVKYLYFLIIVTLKYTIHQTVVFKSFTDKVLFNTDDHYKPLIELQHIQSYIQNTVLLLDFNGCALQDVVCCAHQNKPAPCTIFNSRRCSERWPSTERTSI